MTISEYNTQTEQNNPNKGILKALAIIETVNRIAEQNDVMYSEARTRYILTTSESEKNTNQTSAKFMLRKNIFTIDTNPSSITIVVNDEKILVQFEWPLGQPIEVIERIPVMSSEDKIALYKTLGIPIVLPSASTRSFYLAIKPGINIYMPSDMANVDMDLRFAELQAVTERRNIQTQDIENKFSRQMAEANRRLNSPGLIKAGLTRKEFWRT